MWLVELPEELVLDEVFEELEVGVGEPALLVTVELVDVVQVVAPTSRRSDKSAGVSLLYLETKSTAENNGRVSITYRRSTQT